MRNPIQIDHSHSSAIIQEIGERLQTSLKQQRELPVSLRLQIDRLRQSEVELKPNLKADLGLGLTVIGSRAKA
jgi:hypothetical protein